MVDRNKKQPTRRTPHLTCFCSDRFMFSHMSPVSRSSNLHCTQGEITWVWMGWEGSWGWMKRVVRMCDSYSHRVHLELHLEFAELAAVFPVQLAMPFGSIISVKKDIYVYDCNSERSRYLCLHLFSLNSSSISTFETRHLLAIPSMFGTAWAVAHETLNQSLQAWKSHERSTEFTEKRFHTEVI